VYASTIGYVFAISVDSGKILWKNSNEGHGFHGISVAMMRNEMMSFGMRGFLRKVDKEGKKIGHSFNLTGTGYNLVGQLYFQDCLYTGSSGVVECHNPGDYNVIWKNELKGYGISHGITLVPYVTSVSHTPCVLVGTFGYIICLHADSGVIQWSFSLENTGYGFVSICLQDKKIVAGSFGKLFVLNADDGLLISKDELSGYGYSEICIANDQYNMSQGSSNLIYYRHVNDQKKRRNHT